MPRWPRFDELLSKHGSSKHAEAAALQPRARCCTPLPSQKKSGGCVSTIPRTLRQESEARSRMHLYVLGLCQRALTQHEEAAATFDRLVREACALAV